MPDPIRVPASVRANQLELAGRRTRAKGRSSDPNALARRDLEIRQHHRTGRPAQWIAAEYGLSVSTVYEVLNGVTA
jgi:DNA-binding NarL/FixJ family response regulator